MKWWVEGLFTQCDVDEDREGLLAAVEGCYGYSGYESGYVTHTYFFLPFGYTFFWL